MLLALAGEGFDTIEIISSLQTAKEYPLICAKSMRFKKSFLSYALSETLDVAL